MFRPQPPSGGCVLKHVLHGAASYLAVPAAFGRLCVETVSLNPAFVVTIAQPPSGGCVLKLSVSRGK